MELGVPAKPDGRTHPAHEALRVPQGAEGRDVALQNGLAAALTARRKQGEEAMLAVLLAFALMEACARHTRTGLHLPLLPQRQFKHTSVH